MEMVLPVRKKRVGVLNPGGAEQHGLLFAALAQLFSAEFIPVTSAHAGSLDALIVLNGDLQGGLAAAERGLASYVAVEGRENSRTGFGEVVFGSSLKLDACLRSRTMSEEAGPNYAPLNAQPGDEILASKGGLPVWLARPIGRGACQISAFVPPALQPGEFLFQHLNGRQFLRLLPLVNFIRQVVQDIDWTGVTLPACFVFDDPSLYRPSYGFLDFRRLAGHAVQHHYHVAVATVPFDTWHVNSEVSEIFRTHSPRLSLLIHGNDHTSQELLFRTNSSSRVPVAAQALRRMDRLKNSSGLAFAKIMEAPHGAIAAEAFDGLLALGYAAALGTPECLARHNPRTRWPAELGMDRSELAGAGFPVLPRIRMSAQWKNEVLIAALLRQPIILAGHHIDAMGDLELLAQFAALVNSFDDATWLSPSEIVRSNYKQIQHGDTLYLKLYSREIELRIPGNVRQIFLVRPWLEGEGDAESLEVGRAGDTLFSSNVGRVAGPIRVNALDTLEIASPARNLVDYRTVPAPRLRVWPAARKLMMETRDRSMPWRRGVSALFRRDQTKQRAQE